MLLSLSQQALSPSAASEEGSRAIVERHQIMVSAAIHPPSVALFFVQVEFILSRMALMFSTLTAKDFCFSLP
jgi:hypothetical protein